MHQVQCNTRLVHVKRSVCGCGHAFYALRRGFSTSVLFIFIRSISMPLFILSFLYNIMYLYFSSDTYRYYAVEFKIAEHAVSIRQKTMILRDKRQWGETRLAVEGIYIYTH